MVGGFRETMDSTSSESMRAHMGVRRSPIAVRLLCTNIIMLILSSTALSSSASSSTLAPASLSFQCPPGFFSFGTSLSDTGSVPFAFPFTSTQENLPYGETFFGRNAFRNSDGRLVVDYFSLAFGYPLLSSYFQSVAPNFLRGVNFAAAAATAIPEALVVPLYLDFQVAEFLRFKQSTLMANQLQQLSFLSENLLPSQSTFDQGLYIFFSFGTNDLREGYMLQGLTPATAIATVVPRIVEAIVRGIQTLYISGARNFLVSNVAPQGCSPQILTMGTSMGMTDFDELGCLISYNQVNQALSNATLLAVQTLRTTLIGSSILYFDYYSAYTAVLQNPTAFGFLPEKTLVACCGVGGQYNYNPAIMCSLSGVINNVNVTAGSCSNPNQYIAWDGIHNTDAFYGVIAQFLLTGQFLDPPVNLKALCNLDFSQFTNSTFATAYPNGYLIT